MRSFYKLDSIRILPSFRETWQEKTLFQTWQATKIEAQEQERTAPAAQQLDIQSIQYGFVSSEHKSPCDHTIHESMGGSSSFHLEFSDYDVI